MTLLPAPVRPVSPRGAPEERRHRSSALALLVAVTLLGPAVAGAAASGRKPLPVKLLCATWSPDRAHWSPVTVLRVDCDVPQLAWVQGRLKVFYIRRPRSRARPTASEGANGGEAGRRHRGTGSRPRLAWSEITKDASGHLRIGPLHDIRLVGDRSDSPLDPSVVRLRSGLYRLFYVQSWEERDPARTVTRILSACSQDGVSWKQEKGCRLLGKGVVDPEVVQTPDGRYRMYYTLGSDFCARSAISQDGLNFTPEPGVRVDGGVTSTMRLSSGKYLMVYQTRQQPPRLQSALSDDGLQFTPDPAFQPPPLPSGSTRSEAPSLVQLPDGTWLMTFVMALSTGH